MTTVTIVDFSDKQNTANLQLVSLLTSEVLLTHHP